MKQRYQYCDCKKYQQDIYQNKLYNESDDQSIKRLNAKGLGVRSMYRILGYSKGTIIRRILYLASKVTKPILAENNQTYEVDEMWTYIGSKDPSNYSWIIYAINRRNHAVVDVAFGSRNKKNMTQVIESCKESKIK